MQRAGLGRIEAEGGTCQVVLYMFSEMLWEVARQTLTDTGPCWDLRPGSARGAPGHVSEDLGPGRYESKEVSSPSGCCVVPVALLPVTCAHIWCQMMAFVHRVSCPSVLTPLPERAIMVLYGRVPSLQARMPDDLRWSWCSNNRNKVHNKWNVLESSRNHPPAPGPWNNCLPRNLSRVPKRLGTAAVGWGL